MPWCELTPRISKRAARPGMSNHHRNRDPPAAGRSVISSPRCLPNGRLTPPAARYTPHSPTSLPARCFPWYPSRLSSNRASHRTFHPGKCRTAHPSSAERAPRCSAGMAHNEILPETHCLRQSPQLLQRYPRLVQDLAESRRVCGLEPRLDCMARPPENYMAALSTMNHEANLFERPTKHLT